MIIGTMGTILEDSHRSLKKIGICKRAKKRMKSASNYSGPGFQEQRESKSSNLTETNLQIIERGGLTTKPLNRAKQQKPLY